MAFGALRGTLTNSSTNPGAGISATGSIAVTKGDLIVINYGGRAALTYGILPTDNLGSNYYRHPWNPGIANGAIMAASAYVTANGTLTSVSATHKVAATSSGDMALVVAVFEGPFDPAFMDRTLQVIADSTTPYGCPASGTLGQADELIVGLQAQGNGGAAASYSAVSPYSLAAGASSGTASNTASCAITYHVVSATTGETPSINSSASTAGSTQTLSFRKENTSKVSGDCLGIFMSPDTYVSGATYNATVNGYATIAVGDLIFMIATSYSGPGVSTITDNLGNSYTFVTGGNNSTCNLNAWYSIATNAGTLTAISLTGSAGSETSFKAAAFKGSFSGIDANPATSNSACPATGTLAQAAELVLSWVNPGHSANAESGSPSWIAIQGYQRQEPTAVTFDNNCGAIAFRTVSSTASVTPTFTRQDTGGAFGQPVFGTTSFKIAAGSVASATGAGQATATATATAATTAAAPGAGAAAAIGTAITPANASTAAGIGGSSVQATAIHSRNVSAAGLGGSNVVGEAVSANIQSGDGLAAGLGGSNVTATEIRGVTAAASGLGASNIVA
jgi:hypothetical protein